MKTEQKYISFKLGEREYKIELRIKGGNKIDPMYRGIILDIFDNEYHLVRYIRYTSGEHSLQVKNSAQDHTIKSWKEAKRIILNYILNG